MKKWHTFHSKKPDAEKYLNELAGQLQNGTCNFYAHVEMEAKGIGEISAEATDTAKNILSTKEEHSRIINTSISNPANGLKLLDMLYNSPIITVNMARDLLNVSYPTASSLIGEFCNLGILTDNPEVQRNRIYTYRKYNELLKAGTDLINV